MAFSSVSVVANALTLRRWRGAADAQVRPSRGTPVTCREHEHGQAAGATGLSAKMIRHYESIGLFPVTGTDEGYRQYGEKRREHAALHPPASRPGVLLDQIRELLDLWQNRQPIRAARSRHWPRPTLSRLDQKLAELQAIRATLAHLVHCCHGDDRPDCPIIDSLAQERSELERRPVGATGRSRRGMNGLRAGRGGRATD